MVEPLVSCGWVKVEDQVALGQTAAPFRTPKNLTRPPFRSMSGDRTAELLGHRDTEPRAAARFGTAALSLARRGGKKERTDERVPHAAPLLVALGVRRRRGHAVCAAQRLVGSRSRGGLSAARVASLHKDSPAVKASQTVRRLRPLRRRRERIARPWRVLMRKRKPCFFFRRRLLGWYVLFTMSPVLVKDASGCTMHRWRRRADHSQVRDEDPSGCFFVDAREMPREML